MPIKLNQVLANEKTIKSRSYSDITQMDKANQKAALFHGHVKTYQPSKDDGEVKPTQIKKVQQRSQDVVRAYCKSAAEVWDVTATKDYTNQRAVADVKVGNDTLIRSAPVTFLLFMEKQLTDLRTFIDHMPVLDSSEDWTWDENAGYYKSAAVQAQSTQKVQKAILLAEATKEHPAQAQLITQDEVVGTWTTINTSGAMHSAEKESTLDRIDLLLAAVKSAREEANMIEAAKQDLAEGVLDFLFGRTRN